MGLTNILPERARQVVYAAYAFIGVALGAALAGFAAVPDAVVPTWIVVALAVYAFLGTALGFTAAANVTPSGELDSTFLPSDVHTYYGAGEAVKMPDEPGTGGASPRAPGFPNRDDLLYDPSRTERDRPENL